MERRRAVGVAVACVVISVISAGSARDGDVSATAASPRDNNPKRNVWRPAVDGSVGAGGADTAVLANVLIGGGNVGTNGDASPPTLAMLNVLRGIGATACRTNLYPGSYIARGTVWSSPTPATLDAFMAAAMAAAVTPVLLFEYYAEYVNTTGFGTWDEWRGIGAAFAAYLMPGGGWASAHGAPSGFGVTTYAAINEPDGGAGFTRGSPGPLNYTLALSGLAAGVASACPACSTGPGGFMSVNAHGDATLAGLGLHLAPLWNNGTLRFIDLRERS